MNARTTFDGLRPYDEHLDAETLERIWREIIAADSADIRAMADSGDIERVERERAEPLVIVSTARQPSRRRFALIGAVAVLLLGAGGFAAIRFTHEPASAVPEPDSGADQGSASDPSAPDSVPAVPAITGGPTSVVALVLPALPDGLALAEATEPTVRREPSAFQDRLYGSRDDPGDPTRMIRVEYAESRGIVIPCHSFLSLSMPDGAVNYTATEWMNAATPIEGSTPFAIGDAVGAYCTSPSGLLHAGWFAGSIGIDLSAGTAITTTELVAFAQSLKQVAPSEVPHARPSVDLVPDPLPASWAVLVSEDVPFAQHVTETSWVASVDGAPGDASQLVVQSWIGADEEGVYAKQAPIEANRVTIRGHDGYQYVSPQRGTHGPLEIQIWWTEAPGVVISVRSTDLFEVDALTAIIDDMTPVDAADYNAAVRSAAPT